MRQTIPSPITPIVLAAACLLVVSTAAAAPASRVSPPGAAPARPVEAVITLPASAAGALRALGEIAVYTSAARPLRSLGELKAVEKEVATADLGLARGLMGLLRAGGVKFAGGAYGVACLTSVHHLGTVFRGPAGARLLVMQARPDGPQVALLAKGGALPVVFRDERGTTLGPAPGASGTSATVPPTSATAVPTSFGPLVRATLASTARSRVFAPEQVQRPQLKAGPGKSLLVVHISRDFGAGLGQVSFLFGSGIILEPDFTPLKVVAGSRRLTPTGTYAEGPTLELVYEVPAGARDLRLEDGAASWPLTPETIESPRGS